MTAENRQTGDWGLPVLRGMLPIEASQIPAEVIAGVTLAALATPEAMGDVKEESRHHLDQLFGKDAFFDTLENVVSAYPQQTGPQPT